MELYDAGTDNEGESPDLRLMRVFTALFSTRNISPNVIVSAQRSVGASADKACRSHRSCNAKASYFRCEVGK